jgi:hypothetical protein
MKKGADDSTLRDMYDCGCKSQVLGRQLDCQSMLAQGTTLSSGCHHTVERSLTTLVQLLTRRGTWSDLRT